MDVSPFDEITGVFPVHKLHLASQKEKLPAKIGEIELKISCAFDPTLKLRRMREEKKKGKNDFRGIYFL